MACLIVAEHDHAHLKAATLNTLTAAFEMGGPCDVLVAGSGCAAVAAEAAACSGVQRVLCVDAPTYVGQTAENLAALVVSLAADYSHILTSAGSTGKAFMPRVAALLDVAPISEIVAVISPDTFVRPIYAGNALATVQSQDRVKVMTVRPTAFEAAPATGGIASVVPMQGLQDAGISRVVSRQETVSDRPDLGSAKVVVTGGRGLGSAENYQQLLGPLADKLGAALGASRAAVDAGFAPNDCQVGQTGKIVAPQLYVAIGVSGAIQHLAGMKDSKVIVAINKDPDAPIFQVADYGLVADLLDAVPALTAAL